jgi:putative endopeptidase
MTTSGIDLTELDPSIRPQDDLFRHVNGKWIARTVIPDDRARDGSFYQLHEEAEKAVRDIIIEAQDATPGTEERTFGDLYASFLDEERVEELGTAPIEAQLADVARVSSVRELLETAAHLERQGVGGFFRLFVDNDPGNPERYLVFLEQGGISLPDESYFRDDKFADIRAAYLAHIERMLALAGFSESAARAQRVFDLETAIAATHWDNVQTRDAQATYNLVSWNEFASSASSVDLDLWRSALGAPEGVFDELVVREPSFVSGIAELMTEDRLDAWRDWLSWQVVHGAAAYLPAVFVNENFDFYGRTLTGTPTMRARWKRGVSLVEGAMGEAVGGK